MNRPGVIPARASQCGVALVTAMLVVSLVTIAAVAMATRQQIDVRRAANLLHGEQAYAYALSAESWARVVLRRDAQDNEYDTLEDDWATALPPIAVEGGLVSGRVEDRQGRFNLNNLVTDKGEVSEPDQTFFIRLLENLGLEQELADRLIDWLDKDIEVRFPEGAEDQEYLLLEQPYRAANRPMSDISELRLVKGFEREAVELLLPHVTVLPASTTININTASKAVLQALHPELSGADVELLIEDRGDAGYQDLGDFLDHDALAGLELDVALDVSSDYFRVLTDVQTGQGQARLESLLVRGDNGVRVVYRVRTPLRVVTALPAGDTVD
jgi:general secretion pathway protein K